MTEETRAKFRERLDWLLVPAMIALLLWPALWNGFPLIFPDTGGYLLRPLEGTLALGRSAVYGTFLAAGLPLDFWPNVLIQAAGTVFVIRVLLRTHGLGFGRLVQDGLITRYLDEHCPDEQVSLCRYATALPKTADEWLWTRSSPIHQLGGWEAYTPESKRLILATLRLYPGQHLSTAVKAAIDQFLSFRTTFSVDPDDNFDVIETFERLLSPEANARFLAARQQRDRPDVSVLNLAHVPVAAVSLALVAFIVAFGHPRFGPFTRALCATVLLAQRDHLRRAVESE